MSHGSIGFKMHGFAGYQCLFCNEILSRACKLKQHMSLHTDDHSDDDICDDKSPNYDPKLTYSGYKKKGRRQHLKIKRETATEKGTFVPYKKRNYTRNGETATTVPPDVHQSESGTYLCEICGTLLTFDCRAADKTMGCGQYNILCTNLNDRHEVEHTCSGCGWTQCHKSDPCSLLDGSLMAHPTSNFQGQRESFTWETQNRVDQQTPDHELYYQDYCIMKPMLNTGQHCMYTYAIQPENHFYQTHGHLWENDARQTQHYLYSNPQSHHPSYFGGVYQECTGHLMDPQAETGTLHSERMMLNNRLLSTVNDSFEAPVPAPSVAGAVAYTAMPSDTAPFDAF